MSPLVLQPTLPDTSYRPGEIAINSWSMQSLGVPLVTSQSVPTSNNYVTPNLAVFVPFWVPEPVVITKMGWGNGTAVAGNIDVGISDESGNRLVSAGSTAQSGTSALQVVDVTDTLLVRGRYYLAMASDTSGATQKLYSVVPAAGIPQAFGLLQMAGGGPPLPSTFTFAKYTSAFIPLILAQGYRTVGP